MDHNRAKAVLLRAADILDKPGAWMQLDYARDAIGLSTDPLDPDAVCFCTMGAIMRAAGAVDPDRGDAYEVIGAFSDHVHRDVGFWNDAGNRTQAEVVAALREAAGKL